MNEVRESHEPPRGCGYRVPGGTYLTGEPSLLGSLPTCVLVDPPIPLDTDIIPFTRGVYKVNFDAVFTSDDQASWLVDSSTLLKRKDLEWDLAQYGMRLSVRMKTGMCAGCSPEEVEQRLASLQLVENTFVNDYILSIGRLGVGRRIAREVGLMQQARMDKDWKGLLAACWRVAGYSGKDSIPVHQDLKRIMVSIGALEDAVLI